MQSDSSNSSHASVNMRERLAHRQAVIDIGTNSVKLLVADVHNHQVDPLLEKSRQTRLGKGFYHSNELQTESIRHTAEVVAEFGRLAKTFDPERVRVIATSAVRDSTNQDAFVGAIETASGLTVEVLSGAQEADWVFLGVTTDPELDLGRLLILDVGGGSTEFIVGEQGKARFSHSYPLGSVRLLEHFPPSDPPIASELEAIREHLRHFLANELHGDLKQAIGANRAADDPPEATLVGTGGTITILGRIYQQLDGFDRNRLENARLSSDAISQLVDRLWSEPLEQRRQIVGLPPERADVILMGSVIYEAVMHHFSFTEVRLSTRGLRFAALL